MDVYYCNIIKLLKCVADRYICLEAYYFQIMESFCLAFICKWMAYITTTLLIQAAGYVEERARV